MASIHYRDGGPNRHEGGAQPAPSAGLPVSRWVNYAGAVTSVALVAGLAVWGYKLAVRDLSGVPVIRALEGPARIAPDDPGGDLAAHVGLSVNAVAALGTAAPAPDQVVLAPAPSGLTEADAPMAALTPIPREEPPAESPAQPEVAATPVVPVPDAQQPAPSTESAVTMALAEAMALEIDGETAPEPAPSEAPAAAEPASSQAIPDSVPGVNRSPRPLMRPAKLDTSPAAAPEVKAVADAGPIDIDPASLPEGTRLVQIGAFDTAQDARGEWDKVVAKFGSLLDGKRRVIQEATSGGRTFYRLRVHGFDDVAAARRFCAALLAEQTNCIPAQVR